MSYYCDCNVSVFINTSAPELRVWAQDLGLDSFLVPFINQTLLISLTNRDQGGGRDNLYNVFRIMMHVWSDESRKETYGTPPSSKNFNFPFISPSSGWLFQSKLHSFLAFPATFHFSPISRSNMFFQMRLLDLLER